MSPIFITTRMRVRGLFAPPRLVVALLWLLLLVSLVQADEASEMDEKQPIEKGDATCKSMEEKYNEYKDDGDAAKWLTPCDDTALSGGNVPSVQVPEHGIALDFYSTLPAHADDFGTPLAWFIVAYLNEASIDYNVKLSVPIDLFNATDDYMPPNGYRAELVHEHVLPEAIEKKDANWWWKYTLIFHCYYGTGATGITANPTSTLAEGTKITDPVELRRIQQELNMLLRQGMEIVATFELLQSSHGIVGFAVEDPRLSNTPFIDGPPTMPPTLAPTFTSINVSFPSMSPTTSAERGQYRPNTPTNRLEDDELIDDDVAGEGGVSSTGIKDTKNRQYPTFSDPLRVQQWDWRRYVGMMLFISTFVGTFCLMQVASYRHHRRAVKDLWGNLGSEEGVDALLNTGWKVRGCKMEVYDKRGYGYTDDDSIFLGGYEQRLGAEITVHTQTHETENDSRTITTPNDSQPYQDHPPAEPW